MTLEERIAQVKENIARAAREAGRDPAEVTLVAATKVQSSVSKPPQDVVVWTCAGAHVIRLQ